MFDLKQIAIDEQDSPFSQFGPVQRCFNEAEALALRNPDILREGERAHEFATIMARRVMDAWWKSYN